MVNYGTKYLNFWAVFFLQCTVLYRHFVENILKVIASWSRSLGHTYIMNVHVHWECMEFPFILESLKLPDDVNMLEDPDFV